MLSPKQQFLELPDAAEFRKLIDSELLHKAITHALSHTMLNHSFGKEELNGIRSFIKVLLELGEKEEQPKSMYPAKQLDHAAMSGRRPESKEQPPTKPSNG